MSTLALAVERPDAHGPILINYFLKEIWPVKPARQKNRMWKAVDAALATSVGSWLVANSWCGLGREKTARMAFSVDTHICEINGAWPLRLLRSAMGLA